MLRAQWIVLLMLPAAVAASAIACSHAHSSADGDTDPDEADADTDGGDIGSPAVRKACSGYVKALCAKFDTCNGGMYTQLHFGGAAECMAREMMKCEGTLTAPDNTATSSGLTHCGAALAAMPCADFFDQANNPKSCIPQAGPRANGQPCVDNGQCMSTRCLPPSGASICGTCVARPAAGATCSVTADCGDLGMLCSAAGTCAVPVAEGAACGPSIPCGFALKCVGGDTGTCVPAGHDAGVLCDTKNVNHASCAGDFGMYCADAPGGDQCQPAMLAAANAHCGDVTANGGVPDAGSKQHSFAKCIGGGECDPSGASTGTCTPPAADGAMCDSANGPPCLKPATCVGFLDGGTVGTCMILQRTSCN